MKLIHRLLVIFTLLTLGQTVAVGQTSLTSTELSEAVGIEFQVQSAYRHTDLPVADKPDSLVAKRSFLSTAITQPGKKLDRGSIVSILEVTPKAQQLYRRSQLIKPLGPLLAGAGLAIGYVAIKGTPMTAIARGIHTPTNPNVPDVTIEYTHRSLPLLVGGLGLFVGGLCLIEMSNDLAAKSIQLYNATVIPLRLSSHLDTIKLGITSSGQVGLEAHF